MGSERRGLPDEVWADLDRYLARLERERERRAQHPPKTDEEKQAAALKRRLQRLAKRIEHAAVSLEAAFSDRSGDSRFRRSHFGPLLEDEFKGTARSPGIETQFARVTAEASSGCQLSREFQAKWAATLAVCETLRHHTPPERAPDYDPRERLSLSSLRCLYRREIGEEWEWEHEDDG